MPAPARPLVTSDRSKQETQNYFSDKGYNNFFSFDEFILQSFQELSNTPEENTQHQMENGHASSSENNL